MSGFRVLPVFTSLLMFGIAGLGCSTPPGRALASVSCNDEDAVAVQTSSPKLEASQAQDLWDSCQRIYRCSPSLKSQVRALSAAEVQLVFFDRGNAADGLHLPGTDVILLSDRPRSGGEICSDLYHELIHRFESRSEAHRRPRETLRQEFRAYYFQQLLDADMLAARMRTASTSERNELSARLLTREQVLRNIARVYGLPLDLDLVHELPPYPWEGEGQAVDREAARPVAFLLPNP
jgi:hypothetical protein